MRTNSLLADFEELEASINPKMAIEQFIGNNYEVDGCLYISKEPNENGKYEVSCRSVEVMNKNITSLTNGMFEWKIIGLYFDCSNCHSLASLEGSPKEVHGSFYCYCCNSLTSLKGGPWWVNGDFSCARCNSLTSLNGSPKKVGGDFNCSWCDSLKNLEGSPKEVGEDFDCYGNGHLISLEGITEKIGRNCVFTGSGPIKAPKNIPVNIIENVARYTVVERIK